MRRGSTCVVRFGSGRNKFVQLLIQSQNSSGPFVRSLIFRLIISPASAESESIIVESGFEIEPSQRTNKFSVLSSA